MLRKDHKSVIEIPGIVTFCSKKNPSVCFSVSHINCFSQVNLSTSAQPTVDVSPALINTANRSLVLRKKTQTRDTSIYASLSTNAKVPAVPNGF